MPRHNKTSIPHISQANLFLFELILATVFLSLSSVVCIQLYLRAHTLSTRSAARTHAITEAQNVAELWLAGGALPDEIYYDEDWNTLSPEVFDQNMLDWNAPNQNNTEQGITDSSATDAERSGITTSASYSMELAFDNSSEADGLQTLQITVFSLSGNIPGSKLYSLEVTRYVQ